MLEARAAPRIRVARYLLAAISALVADGTSPRLSLMPNIRIRLKDSHPTTYFQRKAQVEWLYSRGDNRNAKLAVPIGASRERRSQLKAAFT